MIAITFALPQESQDLAHLLTHRGAISRSAHLPILLGNIDQREIVICHTGIGAASAREKMGAFFAHHRPRKLISAGFAGGLDPRLGLGDLVVATNFSSPELLHAADRRHYGTLTSQPHVAATAESKAALHGSTGASAVDMETETIAAACRDFDVPMLSARVISDTADQALPVPFGAWFDLQKQKPRVVGLVRYLARHPRQIRPFVRFVNGITFARGRLTEYLLELLVQL